MSGSWVYVGTPSGPDGLGGAAEVLAVHAAVLPVGSAGQIVYFSGSQWVEPTQWEAIENEANPASDPNYAAAKAQIDHSRVFDCATQTVLNLTSPDADLFCSGHALLPDGRLVIAGGTQHFPPAAESADLHHAHWSGSRETWIYNPFGSPRWIRGPLLSRDPDQTEAGGPMGGGRWYPTLVTLASGDAFALCGHPIENAFTGDLQDFDIRHNNTKPETFSPAIGVWTLINKPLGVDQVHDYAPFYPRLFVVPHTGELFLVQPLYSSNVRAFDPSDPTCVTPPQGQDWCSANPLDISPPYAVNVMDKSLFYDVSTHQVTRAFTGPQTIDPMYVDRFFTSQETAAVMLPLLHEENYHPRVLVCGAVQAAIADLAPTDPSTPLQWVTTAPRALVDPTSHQPPVRYYLNATLLPTGEVAVTGGVPHAPYTDDGIKNVEIYHPAQGGSPDSWAVDTAASETRGYHSVALLMPDGRVWTAGSEFHFTATTNLAIELYEPAYYSVSDRVHVTSSPAGVGYGDTFTVHFTPTSTATPIARVALTRLGSATHSFDGDQRYVSVPFTQSGTSLTVTAPPDATIAPPGYYMLWLIDANGLPCVQAPFIRVAEHSALLVLNRSTFARAEVHALATAGSATFPSAIYVIYDGYMPSEITGTPPSLSFSVAGITATLSSATASAPNPLFAGSGADHEVQRITYAFDLTIPDSGAIASLAPGASLEVMVTATHAARTDATSAIWLINQANPYMLDGPVPWLSTDIRVFSLALTPTEIADYVPGSTGINNPHAFLTALLQHYNTLATGHAPDDPTHPFWNLPTAESESSLYLTPTRPSDGLNVYNFAVAKVRYVGDAGVPADNVRVLFRLFPALTTSLAYDADHTYRSWPTTLYDATHTVVGTDAMALVGQAGGALVAIPFFADARTTPGGSMHDQHDIPNLHDVPGTGVPGSVHYFGCFLDINQIGQPQIPFNPADDGPYVGQSPQTIQALIHGTHQCVVTEVHYEPVGGAPLIHAGDTPSSSDKLSQRNLAWATAGNPGNPATRIVQHPFEILPPPAAAQDKSQSSMSAAPLLTAQGAPLVHEQPLAAMATSTASAQQRNAASGGLILWWNNVPRSASVSLYLPDLDAAAVVREAALQQGAQMLEVIDKHTIGCRPADITYIPLPYQRATPMPGLLTLELPAGIHKGEQYSVHVAEYMRLLNRRAFVHQVVGAFQLNVAVKAEAELLPEAMNNLALMQYNADHLPSADRWLPVMRRYVAQFAARVQALGVDPASIAPSPYGTAPQPSGGTGSAGGTGSSGGSVRVDDARRSCLILLLLIGSLVVVALLILLLHFLF